MTLHLLQLPLYLWIILGLLAVVAIVLFAVACWRIIKRPNQGKTNKLALCLLLMLTSVSTKAMEGDGSYFNPYRIAGINDWNTVATAVNSGLTTYTCKYFRLEADITVNANSDHMMGTEEHPFRGVFDGVGHTLTFEYQNGTGDYVAPFRHAIYSQITRLRVEGTLHTTGRFAGGVVGLADSVAVSSCHVSLNMILDHNSEASSGGIIGKAVNSFIIEDTRFDGVLCTTVGYSTHSCGGFVGWAGTNNWQIKRSFYAPTEMLPSGRKAINTTGCATFGRYEGMDDTNWREHIFWYNPCTQEDCSKTNCLYTHALGLAQGQNSSGMTTEAIIQNFEIGSDDKIWELNSDLQPVPSMRGFRLSFGSIAGLSDTLSLRFGDTLVAVTVYDDSGHELIFGAEYTLKLNDRAVDNPFIVYVNDNPTTYNVTVSGINDGFYGYTESLTDAFTVKRAEAEFSGNGTSLDPYLIQSTSDWDKFCYYMERGAYTASYYKLTADISVTTMASGYSFYGTFDGDNHTITVQYGSAESPKDRPYAAPFTFVDGATIRNLTVTGTIYSSQKYASGLLGYVYGNTKLENCRSNVTVVSTVAGDATNGGLIGLQSTGSGYTVIIDRCVFDGKLLGANTTNCGGFVGWRNNMSLKITNSIYAPAAVGVNETEVGASGSSTFSRNGYTTITNSFYTRALGEQQGALSYPMTQEPAAVLGNEVNNLGLVTVYEHGLKYNNQYYVAAAINLQENADNSPLLRFCNGYLLSSVTLQGRTFYKDNKWNTLCLPFDLGSLSGTPLEDADIRTLSGAEFNSTTGTLTLNFTDEGAISSVEAGKPYIIRWTSGQNSEDPVFQGVTISHTLKPVTVENLVSFCGTYSHSNFEHDDTGILFVGGNDTLYYPREGAHIQAMHAYFQLLGNLTAGTPADPSLAPLRIVMNVGETQTGTDLQAVPQEQQAQKFIRDGRLYIRRDGVEYNALGQLVQ